jgi:hypothetical protein
MHTDSDPVGLVPGDSDVQEGRLVVSDLRPGGARPVDEGEAQRPCHSVCVCGRLTWWSWSTINNDVTNHEAEGRRATTTA